MSNHQHTLIIDGTSGISGDKTVAALLDLGASEEHLREQLATLPVDGFEIAVTRVNKHGIDACDFDVQLAEELENHDHDMAWLYGNEVDRLYDVGVAGLHRLLAHAEELAQAQVVIAIAGMEGALASVIGGLVSCPVIAVPTSVGYGASFGGVAALLAMLNSCASGVSVVNIDNGFGAAYQASLINHLSAGTSSAR